MLKAIITSPTDGRSEISLFVVYYFTQLARTYLQWGTVRSRRNVQIKLLHQT